MYLFILSNNFHPLLMYTLHFVGLSPRACCAQSSQDASPATYRIRTRLILRFFHLSNRSDLIQLATQHLGIRNFFRGLGQLQKHDSGANYQEAHDNIDDLCDCPPKTTKQDS